LGDASRFAASLSYTFGEYVSVISSDPPRKSILRVVVWGVLWQVGRVPPPDMRDKLGLEAPPERGIVEESVEAAEDKRRRAAEKTREIAVYRENAGRRG
jgi:hypothetical protein